MKLQMTAESCVRAEIDGGMRAGLAAERAARLHCGGAHVEGARVRRGLLLAIPLSVATLYLVALALVPVAAREPFYVAEVAVVKLLGLIGCVLAASRYRRGEYLHVAWSLLGVHYGLLFVYELAFGTLVHLPGLSPGAALTGRAICVVAANLASSACAIMLARVWRMLGAALPGSPARQKTAVALAIIVAVALVGWGIARDLRQLIGGDRAAILGVAADLGDLVSFSVIAPLSLVAIAMRGGTLAWPWGLITASYLTWLVYDMMWSFAAQLPMSPRNMVAVAELWRALACALALSAGLAQRQALRARSSERS
jgi:hypothetical protein